MTYYGLQSIVEVLHDLAQESWGHAWAQRRGIASHNPKDMVESMLPYLGNVNENDGTHPLTTIAKEVLRHLPDLSHDDIHPRLQVLDPGLYGCIRQRLMEALDGPIDHGPE
ncbi:MAG: hypothetical protein EA402_14285 [Planctomycetota bacterium]|nr:MAG: hypothetical protein EA402_14285 [Planctomycetota bacterium]